MGESFPKSVSEVVSTLAEIFRHQGNTEVCGLLENAHARFDETDRDNWNGGTYTWALRLEVPVSVFAALEPRLSSIEESVLSKLAHLDRQFLHHNFGEVSITPIAPGASVLGQRMAPSEIEVKRIWKNGYFRLFLSHLSEEKLHVSKLKIELERWGIDAFVAHEDIEPSLKWQDEIELGLRSMHALVALISPKFHESKWTDQEIGWALGREVLVLPVRLGKDPYGFFGKFQGISGTFDAVNELASSIATTLLSNSQTHAAMRRSLAYAFSKANTYKTAQMLKRVVVGIHDFSDEEKAIILKACVENNQVSDAFGVTAAIYHVFGKPAEKPASVEEDVPF